MCAAVLLLSALLFSSQCLKRILDFSAKCGFVSRYGSDHLLNTAHAVIVGLLPDDILFRRKSPYPKTYDTNYEKLLTSRVREIMNDSSSPVMQFLDRKKLETFLQNPSDYGKPWYGQLMAGPQMLAYILQIDYWMKTYKITLV